MYNKQRRTYEREVDQTRIPSWWREAGRSTCERRQVSTGPNPGDAASSPRVPNHGSLVHRDRIPRHLKPGNQRISSRVCLELDPTWTCSTRCGSSIVLWQNGYAGACKTSYPGSIPGNTSKLTSWQACKLASVQTCKRTSLTNKNIGLYRTYESK